MFYLMLYFEVVYEVFNRNLDVVKACATHWILLGFNSGEASEIKEFIDLCHYYSCETNEDTKQKISRRFQKKFRSFYAVPEDSSVTRWAAREVASL